MLSSVLDLIFPPRCAACRTLLEHGGALCAQCRALIPLHAAVFCGECGRSLRAPARRCHSACPYRLAAATDYAGTIKSLLHALKFDLVRDAAEELGGLLAKYAAAAGLPLENRLIIPIPLSRRRERERGFNQSLLITQSFLKCLREPSPLLAPNALWRNRHTPAQSQTTSLEERLHNLKGCFTADFEAVRGKDLIIVDDVATSGATLAEAAHSLRAAGAADILAIVCAKTPS